MMLQKLQDDATQVIALLAPNSDAAQSTAGPSAPPTLLYSADDLRSAAYSVMAGDPAQPHIGSDRRSPFSPDLDGRTKREVLRRAEFRDTDYFARMLAVTFSPGRRIWIDKESGDVVEGPATDRCRPIDVMTIARYLPAVLAYKDLAQWVERQALLLPAQVGLARPQRIGAPEDHRS